MNKVLLATAAMLGAIASLPAIAAETDNPSGFYVGAGWGQFNLDIDNIEEAGSAISDIAKSDDNAWKIFAGYRINPYIALEGAYIDFGRPGDTFDTSGSHGNYEVGISGFAPYIIGTIPIGPVEVFGKVGYYFYDVDLKVDLDAPGPDIDSSHSESDFLYGAGIGFTLAERLHLRAEYEIVDIDNADNSDAIWLSAAWRF
jgi:OOP family OmpA-OmpF porin